jgi:hypothetical protein
MRRLIVLGVLTALAAAVLATPASASFDHHFAVIAKAQSGRFTGDKFRFKDKLVDPENRSDKVGRDWGWCKARANTPARSAGSESFAFVATSAPTTIGSMLSGAPMISTVSRARC